MSNELDLRDYFHILRKRAWWIAAFVLLITIAAGLYSIYVKDPVYQASTKIIVNRTSTTVAANQQQLDLNEVNTNIRMIDTYKEIIKTPAILDLVLEKYPQFQLTSDQLMDKIKVSSVNNTQVMTVIVTDLSYTKAAQIANAVSEVFKQEIPSLFNVENVSILNHAKENPDTQPGPISPNIPLNIAIAFIVSFMLALGAAFLVEYMDDSIKTEADVEKYLDLPTLVSVARVNAEEHKSNKSSSVRQAGDLEHVTVNK